MDFEVLQKKLFELNEEELFYKRYYYSTQQEYSHKLFLSTMDMDFVKSHHLIIPEMAETVPPMYEDYWIFDAGQPVTALKHNCYTPAIVHNHTFFELTYVYDGRCTQQIGDKTVELRGGDFILMPPEVKHSISVFDESVVIQIPVKKSTLENIFFNFLRDNNIISMFFINSIYARNVNDYIIFHTGTDFHIKTAVTFLLWENINRDTYWITMMTNTLMNIFTLMLRYYSKSVELPAITRKEDIQRFGLIRFIQENYTDINLGMIADKFHYTPEYTSKIIKEYTGLTFKQILQKIRIERAESLLLDSNMSIQNIGYQVGYENTEHFIRTFKKIHQLTPTEYRKNNSGVLR